MIAIADAKTEIYAKDAQGRDVWILSHEDGAEMRYFGMRQDGIEIKNPDYLVDAEYIDD